jgi:hypothetical protein
MKTGSILILLLLCQSSFGQMIWEINFEDWYYGEDRIYIDTISNQDNIWQVGQPNKIIFNTAYSEPNAIITDTSNHYPTNDTSSLLLFIWHKKAGWVTQKLTLVVGTMLIQIL